MRIIYEIKVSKDEKSGKEKKFTNFYVETDNGVAVPIQPVYYQDKNGEIKYSSFRDLKLIGYEIK